MTDSDDTADAAPKEPAPQATPPKEGPPKEPKTRKPRAAAPKKTAGSAPARKPGGKGSRKAPPPPQGTALRAALIVAAVIIAIDQLTKYIVVHALNLKVIQELTVWEPWLNLRMAWNQGVNFGLFSSDVEVMRWVLIAVALAVCLWVAVWLWRARPGRLAQVASGLLIGGALGNVIDRVAYGAVADFLNMSLPGWRNPYSFNVADIAIFAGALGLVFLPAREIEPDKTRDGRRKTR